MGGKYPRPARWGKWTVRCELLGWHAPRVVEVRGINAVSDCRRCGRSIMLDSQGNWFEYRARDLERKEGE